ncbi:MAG: AAA family ATPase, partial [Candidatus Bathyarchaeia archaeon]
MKIAISGKGGVGKTLVAGVLADFFAKKGFKVLAIDADPSPNLALTLGIPLDEANKIVPVSENTQLLESKTRTSFPGVYRLSFTVDDIVEKFGVKSPYGMNLLVMGIIRSAGEGCTCPANAVIRELLRHLIVERDEVVVMDMEAGVEHMGRGTARHVDIMLIVADSSLKSLETAKKIYGLATEAGIKNAFIV